MDRALGLKPEVTQGCGFESRLWQEVSTTEVRPLSKAPNPQCRMPTAPLVPAPCQCPPVPLLVPSSSPEHPREPAPVGSVQLSRAPPRVSATRAPQRVSASRVPPRVGPVLCLCWSRPAPRSSLLVPPSSPSSPLVLSSFALAEGVNGAVVIWI